MIFKVDETNVTIGKTSDNRFVIKTNKVLKANGLQSKERANELLLKSKFSKSSKPNEFDGSALKILTEPSELADDIKSENGCLLTSRTF
ncbi:hypothetical protein MHBO_000198 [Bonamia ostreae]|uniref:Uncharacterized protein n=1 Tax=Bonamia ostreae TaxID=126728 RepID=A0ABV2AES9_9EUKA